MREFADRLRHRAVALRMSNAELARRIGLSDQRLGNYLAGTREPDLDMLSKLASALETTPNELLGFQHDTSNEQLSQLRERGHRAIDALASERIELVVPMIEALL